MKAPRLASLGILAALTTAACSPDVSLETRSTSSVTGTGGSSGTGGSGGAGAGGALPTGCPETLPAPQDCGAFADHCGNATPLAAGGELTFATGALVTSGHVWFVAEPSWLGPCGGFFYRVPKGGGAAERGIPADRITNAEAEGDTIYLVASTDDPETTSIRAIVGDDQQSIGDIHHVLTPSGYPRILLTPTPGGVVTYDASGPTGATFFRVSLGGLEPIPADMPVGYLGSAPAYDGQAVFVSLIGWNNDTLWDRKLARVSASPPLALASEAGTRLDESIVADVDTLFFATGDPGSPGGLMGISRVAKAGGAATPILPPAYLWISQILIDDAEVFYAGWAFAEGAAGIWAVPKAGGAVRRVWAAVVGPTSRVRMDAQNLYFSVDGRENSGEITGPGGFIVRVAKSTSLP